MAFKNFKVETDADGIALVTWDIPGRSMNVLDETTITELEEIVKQTSADAAVKGVVITSGKEAFCAGADLSMLEGMNRQVCRPAQGQGRGRRQPDAVRPEPPILAGVSRHRDLAASRGSPRSTGWRSAAASNSRCPAITASRRKIRRPVSDCPKSRSGSSPAPAAPSACRASCSPQDAMQLLLKGEAINLDKAKALKLIDAIVPAADLDQVGQGLDQGRRQGDRALGREGFQAAGRRRSSPRPA